MTVSVDQIRTRIRVAEERRRRFESKALQPGKLVRHEVWRHNYLAQPYLLGAPDSRVADRFGSIFLNVSEIGEEGKIRPVPFEETDEYMQVFTHLTEEYGLRLDGPPPVDVVRAAREPMLKYFEQGTPIGIRMFAGYSKPSTPILVKYGKREFLEPMLRSGHLRIANASSYNNAAHNDAVRDDETSRTFFIPTYMERLAGKRHLDFQGHRLEFNDDDITMPLVFNDYYLLSLCRHIHPRMPTDFSADAAIVIKDPGLFIQRVISHFLARLPDWNPLEGNVIYYDPYRDYSKFRVPEMAKHFGYGYQREFRIAFRSSQRVTGDLSPVYLTIGSMEEYADLVTM